MADFCNLCNADTFDMLKRELRDDKLKYKVYRCTRCGHIQLLPRPGENEDREFYNRNLYLRFGKTRYCYSKNIINGSNKYV